MTFSSALLAQRLEVLALANDPARLRLAAALALVTRQVRFASDLHGLMMHLWRLPPDVIIVTSLTQASGLPGLCQQVRQFLQTPLLIIEEGATEDERISWLDSGADDVIALASSTPAELGARYTALLRRMQRQQRRDPTTLRLHALGMQLDVVERRLYLGAGQALELSLSQLRLLALLFSQDGGVVTDERLAEHLVGSPSPAARRHIAALVYNLNRHIERVHTSGYRLSLHGAPVVSVAPTRSAR